MGIIEINPSANTVTISSTIIYYGNAADFSLSKLLSEEIETLWNEPQGKVLLHAKQFLVVFKISTQYNALILPQSIIENQNPKNNYIRIEEFSKLNISCMDGIGSNTGYFQLNNLYVGSTTAAHEYGHSLGLPHPTDLNIVGKGVPGIMYPRGTLVNQEFQNDPIAIAGGPGGTLNPKYRKVMQTDIDNLKIAQLVTQRKLILGKFTNIYHEQQVKPEV
ncbi:MAG TPA: peptidase M10 [Chitinophagales bacterium]|nr:peptidase M10 [Chitinophagales bacterium]HNM32993.1 peptidase M10 [Chitinophagales bacterium]